MKKPPNRVAFFLTSAANNTIHYTNVSTRGIRALTRAVRRRQRREAMRGRRDD